MSRVERIGDATLYLGDCREILPGLRGIDAVVTDPPFAIPHKFGVQANGSRVRTERSGGRTGRRRLQFDWDGPDTGAMVLSSVAASASMGMAHFWFCGLHSVSPIADALRAAGMIPKPAVWVKTCPPPAGFGNWWPSGFEHAVYAYRHGAWFGDADPKRCNVFIADSMRHGQPGKVPHPTQKPIGLIERICGAVVPPGGVALDPFMGSGTTGVACARLGRRFIGIEIDEAYFDIACRRIEAEARAPHLPLVLSRARQDALL